MGSVDDSAEIETDTHLLFGSDRYRVRAIGLAVMTITAAVVAVQILAGNYEMLGLLALQSALVVALVRSSLAARQRRQLAETASMADQRFRSIVQHSSDLTAVTDPEGRFRYLGPAFTRILGYELRDLDAKPAIDIIHPDD